MTTSVSAPSARASCSTSSASARLDRALMITLAPRSGKLEDDRATDVATRSRHQDRLAREVQFCVHTC